MLSFWLIATFASFRSRGSWELLSQGGIDAQVVFQAVSWVVFGAIAVVEVARGRADLRPAGIGPLFFYCIFGGLALLSSLFSSNIMLTCFYAAQILIAVALVLIAEPLWSIYRLSLYYVLVNWLLVLLGLLDLDFGQSWIAPAREIYVRYGGSEWEGWRFTSAFGHPSQIGIVAAMAATGLAANLGRASKGAHKLAFALFVLTTVLTVSRTAVSGMVLGMVIVVWRRGLTLPVLAALTAVGAMMALFEGLRAAAFDYLMRGQTEQEFASFTGRSDLYALALERLPGSWLGDGFRSLRDNLLVAESWGQGVSHAHNLVLTALIDLGLLGAATVLASLASFVLLAWRVAFHPSWSEAARRGPAAEALAVAMPIVAFCTLDSGFAVNVDMFVIAYIAYCVRLGRAWLACEAAPRSVQGRRIDRTRPWPE